MRYAFVIGAMLLGGCAWPMVDAYTTPAHTACANLHDGVQSDSCHVYVYRSGDTQDVTIAESVAKALGFEQP